MKQIMPLTLLVAHQQLQLWRLQDEA